MTGKIEYLLDTDCVSSLIRAPRGPVEHRIRQVGLARVAVSVIVAAELRYGRQRRDSARLSALTSATLERLPVLPLEPPADSHYAELRDALERSGTPIGWNDMLIAAHALALDLTLVTGNEREFRRVPGLRVENWLESQART